MLLRNLKKLESKDFSKRLLSVIKQAEVEAESILNKEEVVFIFEAIESGKRKKYKETLQFHLGKQPFKNFVEKSKEKLAVYYGNIDVLEIKRT